MARRAVLSCHHYHSPANQLLYLGTIDAGEIPSKIEDSVLGADKQMYIETPLLEDNFVWLYTRKSDKNLKKTGGKLSRANHGLVSFMRIKPSREAEVLLKYPAEAFSSCGFEVRWSVDDGQLFVHLYLKESSAKDLNIAHRAVEIRKLVRGGFNRCANTVLGLSYPHLAETLEKYTNLWVEKPVIRGRENFDAFFKIIREHRRDPPSCNLRLDGISTTLLPFQKDAVNFMINKENYAVVDRKELLRVITLPEDDDIQYFPCLGIFVRCSSDQIPFTDEVQGGILADEMGLGKTVELLALILSNTQDVQKTRSEGENKEESNDSAVCQSPTDKDVAATLEFLTSSVVAMADTGYLSPPKKRFRSAFPNTKTNRQDSVACSMCSVKYNMREIHWLREYEQEGRLFTCPQCIEDNNMDFDVSATLIIVPESLLHQWYEEIRRHCKDEVVVDIYYGVGTEGYKHPVYINTCNIVLCTYETLQKEIFYVPWNSPSKELRKRPRGNIEKHPSPLLAVNFLRICLDESQLVESKVKAAAKMCSLLRARNHWCVSGTPLSKSVNDLYGLICFLGLFPYYIDAVWEHYVFNPWTIGQKEAMVNLMTQLLWRNSKEDVADQLDNIIRRDRLIELSFSPIEERLYSAKIENSKEKMRALMDSLLHNNNPDTPLSSLPSATVDAIFAIINDVRISILAGESHKRRKDLSCISDFRMFSPKLIFRKLFEDARTTIVQRHREMVANRNALAGIYMLLGDELGALNWYKQAYSIHEEQKELNRLLGLVEDVEENQDDAKVEMDEDEGGPLTTTNPVGANEGEADVSEAKPYKPLEIDSLQMVHIARNVKELALTLEEARKFMETSDLVQLEERYHRRFARAEVAMVAKAKRRWCELDRKWREIDGKFDAARMSYVIMLDSLVGTCAFKEFEEAMPFLRKPKQATPLTAFDFLLLFDEEILSLRRIFTKYREMLQLMLLPFQPKTMDGDVLVMEETLVPPRSDLQEFTDMLACCHNTWLPMDLIDGLPVTQHFLPFPPVTTCMRCKVEALISQISVDLSRRGKGWYEGLLARMYRVCRGDVMTAVHPFYELLLKWLTFIEKMIRIGREMTTFVQEWVNRERELVMGAMRFQFGMKISIPYLPRPLPLSADTLDIAIAIYDRTETVAAKALSSSLSALRYLNTLQRENNTDPEMVRECPCCYMELNEIWIVFPCAHIICASCMKRLKSMPSHQNKVRCITCRQVFPIDATMYVVDKKDDLIPGVRLTVKFEQIIRHLKKLIEEDSTNKILVFTSIATAIPPFAALLKLLKLPFAVLDRGSKSKILSKFRSDPELKILVMPLRMGANGLNLTQANHVVFMEPITEMSVFAQAVGRIDRIGQRRAITVHNFVVKGSIEEEIYGIVNRGYEQSKWTLNTLREVFGIQPRNLTETDDVLLAEL
ncbi:hypothetical protein Aduo_013323 [Ancylostoma duodenale]